MFKSLTVVQLDGWLFVNGYPHTYSITHQVTDTGLRIIGDFNHVLGKNKEIKDRGTIKNAN